MFSGALADGPGAIQVANSPCIQWGQTTGGTQIIEKRHIMRARLIATLIAAFTAPVAGPVAGQTALPTAKMAPAQSAASADQLTQVQNHLRGITSLSANFLQTGSTGKSARGKMLLLRPGKIRFEYEPSVPTLIVANGNWMSVVDYGNNQVQRWPIKDTPLSILLDPNADLRKLGKIAVGPGAVPGFITVEATDPKRPQFGKISLFFQPVAGAPGGVMLNSWQVLDAQGNTTLVQLSDLRLNPAIAASAFTFKDPTVRRMGSKGQ
jgi:outer membrane lipoprotein-sorting protein